MYEIPWSNILQSLVNSTATPQLTINLTITKNYKALGLPQDILHPCDFIQDTQGKWGISTQDRILSPHPHLLISLFFHSARPSTYWLSSPSAFACVSLEPFGRGCPSVWWSARQCLHKHSVGYCVQDVGVTSFCFLANQSIIIMGKANGAGTRQSTAALDDPLCIKWEIRLLERGGVVTTKDGTAKTPGEERLR